jgi:uncharacterized protein YbjT (DUF2867 family)
VAKAVAEAALGSPVNETMEIAGPERLPLSELVARYLGARLDDRSLVPGGHAHLGTIRLEEWLRQPRAR